MVHRIGTTWLWLSCLLGCSTNNSQALVNPGDEAIWLVNSLPYVSSLPARCETRVAMNGNQIASSHHTLTGVLYSEDKLYKTKIYDINPVIDPMGCGDAFVAAFIHARMKWSDNDQRCLDFAIAGSAIKNTIIGDQSLANEDEIIEVMNQ